MYFIQWLRGNQGALLWPFLLRLLTEPSSHGVQDHQLGMFFFPLALPFFHLLFTPSKEQKRHLSSLSLSFTVGNLLEFQHLFDLSAGYGKQVMGTHGL
jgi:hypothetical protein